MCNCHSVIFFFKFRFKTKVINDFSTTVSSHIWETTLTCLPMIVNLWCTFETPNKNYICHNLSISALLKESGLVLSHLKQTNWRQTNHTTTKLQFIRQSFWFDLICNQQKYRKVNYLIITCIFTWSCISFPLYSFYFKLSPLIWKPEKRILITTSIILFTTLHFLPLNYSFVHVWVCHEVTINIKKLSCFVSTKTIYYLEFR